MSSKPNSFMQLVIAVFMTGLNSTLFVTPSRADAPPDASVVNLRTTCTEGGVQVPNCFTTMAAMDNWLRNVRQAGPERPTLVEIGPGTFGPWACVTSNVTLRGSGRDQTVISGAGALQAVDVGCTDLNVQDLKIDGTQSLFWGVIARPGIATAWTNVEIVAAQYGWVDFADPNNCPSERGRHFFFNSRITTEVNGELARSYVAVCAASWFWGSEITSTVASNVGNAFALEAKNAEIHLYGSNARLILSPGIPASSFGANGQAGGTYLMAALQGSNVHIHGTGLDMIHNGTGTADMLYADATSHFHANESGFNIHVSGSGKVNRVVGGGTVEAPYIWGAGAAPPLSASQSSVQTLASRNGMDSYIETDCPFSSSADCSAGATLPVGSQYPRLMVYRKECTGTASNQGAWFDTVKRSCRN